MYHRAITSFKVVGSETPWYGLMCLDELNRTILGRPGFDHFERSYSFAVHWGLPLIIHLSFPLISLKSQI